MQLCVAVQRAWCEPSFPPWRTAPLRVQASGNLFASLPPPMHACMQALIEWERRHAGDEQKAQELLHDLRQITDKYRRQIAEDLP